MLRTCKPHAGPPWAWLSLSFFVRSSRAGRSLPLWALLTCLALIRNAFFGASAPTWLIITPWSMHHFLREAIQPCLVISPVLLLNITQHFSLLLLTTLCNYTLVLLSSSYSLSSLDYKLWAGWNNLFFFNSLRFYHCVFYNVQYRAGVWEIVDEINYLISKLRTKMTIVPAHVVLWCQLCFCVTLGQENIHWGRKLNCVPALKKYPSGDRSLPATQSGSEVWDVHPQYLQDSWPSSLPLFHFSGPDGLSLAAHQFLFATPVLLTQNKNNKMGCLGGSVG